MLTLEEIGARIQRARITAAMNQAQLSEKVKERGLAISRETISKIESGERPLSALELPVFAEVLQVSIMDLLHEETTDDLVTLFRAKTDVKIVENEIFELQDMLKEFIKQKKLFEGKLTPRKRVPIWEA